MWDLHHLRERSKDPVARLPAPWSATSSAAQIVRVRPESPSEVLALQRLAGNSAACSTVGVQAPVQRTIYAISELRQGRLGNRLQFRLRILGRARNEQSGVSQRDIEFRSLRDTIDLPAGRRYQVGLFFETSTFEMTGSYNQNSHVQWYVDVDQYGEISVDDNAMPQVGAASSPNMTYKVAVGGLAGVSGHSGIGGRYLQASMTFSGESHGDSTEVAAQPGGVGPASGMSWTGTADAPVVTSRLFLRATGVLPPPVARTATGFVRATKTIYFDRPGAYHLPPGSRGFNELVAWYQRLPQMVRQSVRSLQSHIQLEGYASAPGTAADNVMLANRRVQAARAVLATLLVRAPSALEVFPSEAHGEEVVRSDREDESERRVEASVWVPARWSDTAAVNSSPSREPVQRVSGYDSSGEDR